MIKNSHIAMSHIEGNKTPPPISEIAHDSFIGKREALAVSGIAILLMVFHHFFGFDDFRNPQNYYIESFNIHGISFERMLAAFGKICVSIFAFLSGYALYKMADNYRTYPKVLLRLGRFLIDHWIVMALFLLYAVIIGDELPDIHNFMLNLAGLATLPVSTYVNVAFAWYVAFYILWLLLAPLTVIVAHRLNGIQLLCLLVAYIATVNILPLGDYSQILSTFISAFVGVIVCKWRIFDRLSAKYADIPCLAVILVLIAIPIMRQSLILVNPGLISAAEVIITPLFIFFSILFIRRLDNGMNKILRYRATLVTDMLCALGMMSMNIWFLHGIFFTGRRPLQDLVYSPHYPVLIYAFAFLLLIPAARAVALLQKRIHTLQ